MDFLDRSVYFQNQTIVREGTPVTSVILLVRGSVRVTMRALPRQYVFGAGTLLGFRSIVDGKPHPVFRSTATAIEEVECIRLNYTELAREYDDAGPIVKRVFHRSFWRPTP